MAECGLRNQQNGGHPEPRPGSPNVNTSVRLADSAIPIRPQMELRQQDPI